MEKKFAPDIVEKINSDFPMELVAEVTKILVDAVTGISIVGSDQLARSLLFLCKGDIKALKEEYIPAKSIDPRNIVLWAEEDAGNQGHYFGITFDEIANLEFIDHKKAEREYWEKLTKEEEERENLPPEFYEQ